MKQQQLTFDKGITNVPSDAVCADNTLEESLGMVYEHSEHRVIQKPKEILDCSAVTGLNVIYIHKFNDSRRYIYYIFNTTANKYELYWGIDDDGTLSPQQTQTPLGSFSHNNFIVTSIGKTLIVSIDGAEHYYIWKEDAYTELSQIPDIDIAYYLYDRRDDWKDIDADDYSSVAGIVDHPGGAQNWTIEDGKQQDYNNIIIGRYSVNKKKADQKLRFTRPFFLRAAVEMYDGSFTKMTAPVLMMPTIGNNSYVNVELSDTDKLWMYTYACKLGYRLNTDYTAYSDIVNGVVLFMSDQIETLKTDGDMKSIRERAYDNGGNLIEYDYLSVSAASIADPSICLNKRTTQRQAVDINDNPTMVHAYYVALPEMRNDTAIEKDLVETSVFYKLADLGKASTNGSIVDIDKVTSPNVLENITTQQQLPYDDYFSHTQLSAALMYAYNSRLNIANVSRSFFKGFDSFVAYDNDTENEYNVFVEIGTDYGDKLIQNWPVLTTEKQGMWFYYPDTRAKHVMIFKRISLEWKCILDTDLTQHTGLNGAYYFWGLPISDDYDETIITEDPPALPTTNDNNDLERLPNYIITSEVNNPWVFLASGYNKVGTGKILAMSTITQALSEGQFGQYPLLVFSESGIWAMATDNTGLFRSIHPLSREVSLDPPCIVQTDGAVFFTSEKGLMVVVGNQVKCVSEQLSGKSSDVFVNYLRTAFIAYDYRDSLLWIFKKPEQDDQRRTCWIYGIKSSTFAHYDFGVRPVDGGVVDNIITNVVNDYPDTLLQCDDNKLYTLLNRNNINEDVVGHTETDPDTQQEVTVYEPIRYKATLMSRPMKLEDALALKTIMQVRNITDFNVDAHIKLVIKASNNLRNWVQLGSLRGMPWKYYKFKYEFENLLATDRFAGSVIVTEERRSNKLR